MSDSPQRRALSALAGSDPILDCRAAAAWEAKLLPDEAAVWQAMQRAGIALAEAIRADYAMTRAPQRGLDVLVLAGKGHNGGDALLAARHLAEEPRAVASVTVFLLSPLSDLKPLARRAFELLDERRSIRALASASELADVLRAERFHLCIDGALGMAFCPPLRAREAEILKLANEAPNIDFRAAVDLPSGVGDASDPSAFAADATYATGVLKTPLLAASQAGVLRYLDIGFFSPLANESATERVIAGRILDPLRAWRPARSEKRRFGHLAILGGSRSMPGALAMSVAAALRSGAGLVTVFAPESMVASLASLYPEAMWRAWPETPEGGLALEGLWQIRAFLGQAAALLMGPGMGRERETQALLADVAGLWDKPIVVDGDALQPDIVEALRAAGNASAILTPHDGELARLTGEDASDDAARRYAEANEVALVRKGSSSRVLGGGRMFLNTTGNAVLARGGSGDMLAGLAAGLLAQFPDQPLDVACAATHWHGKAADLWAAERGQTAVRSTELLDFLSAALESRDAWNPNSPESRPFGS